MDAVNLQSLILTGIEAIDEGHGGVVVCLEEMQAAVEAKVGTDAILDILERMRFLVSRHFQVEEGMMAAVRYDRATSHKDLHCRHLAHVDGLIAAIRAGEQPQAQMLSALRMWFFEHLRTMDCDLADLLRQRR